MRSDSFQSERDVVEDLIGYQPFNWIPIAAFLLAIPGCLGIFHSAFLVFPAVAFGVAAYALRRNYNFASNSSGVGIALAAMALSAFMLCFVTTLRYLNVHREHQFVENAAEKWLELLRGHSPNEAYLLTLEYYLRPTSADQAVPQVTQTGKNIEVVDSLDQFLAQAEVAILANPEIQITKLGVTHKLVHSTGADFNVSYGLQIPGPKPMNMLASIEIYKRPDLEGTVHWQVGGFRIAGR